MADARRRRLLRLLGDFLLGLSLGLLAYEALTGLVAWRAQQDLRQDFARVAEAAPSSAPTATLDFTGWETKDARYWRGLKRGDVFGRIVAEKAGIDAVVVKGVTREALKNGPGWAEYTDLPGPTGNAGISGHRTTYLAPFRRLDALRRGDTIDVFSPYRRYRYRVFRIRVVRPDQWEVMRSTEEPRLTLTACHPPYSARFRLVVQARLVEVARLP